MWRGHRIVPGPKLRSKIRLTRPDYRVMLNPVEKEKRDRKDKKKPPKRIRDNKSVSQCLRQAWTLPSKVALPATTSATATKINKQQQQADEQPDEEYIKIATQQEPSQAAVGIQAIPSVSLFDRQQDVLARYIFNETTEAQIDRQLQQLLDGFQAEYESKCAELEGSPPPGVRPGEHDANDEPLQATCLPATSAKPVATIRNNSPTGALSPPLLTDSEPFIMPDFSKEIAQLEDMMELDSPQRPVPELDPLVPIVEILEEPRRVVQQVVVPTVTENACLDLSVQREKIDHVNRVPTAMSIDEECTRAHLIRPAYVPAVPAAAVPPNSQRFDDILDLRVSTPWKPRSAAVTVAPSKSACKPLADTAELGTQTRWQRRNVGIQHRPLASFDFTDRNLIVLAQALEADPARLKCKMRSVVKSSAEPIWRTRDLAAVFSLADPYYANLKQFL
ncbi:uncharacterized protein LOC121592678 [Anopheles merus]|uniref:uncharacterized protein LOC121592678 n=1 Tax=Anopheles merus TaxID=30066 RepID=UPI001BE477A6|nr:uncharacterized protein LOC121592678 [Anopheles merus]XP_041770271.1 uncharacterized protein LOC121592678 [Anopheles merus]